MNCKNCKNRVVGKYCSNCGQKSTIDRINFTNVLNEVSESLFQINRGFFYTIRELFVRPGSSLNEYLTGKRKSHFKPFAYVLTLSTVYFLITQITNQNTWMDDTITGWMNGVSGQNSEFEMPNIANWFAKNYAYSSLLLLPVFSLASYISFRKFGKNYLEHIVVNSYITGHQAIIYSLFAILGISIEHEIIELLSLLLAITYTIWTFNQLFMDGNRIKSILRTILTYILYLIFSLGLLMLLAGITEL